MANKPEEIGVNATGFLRAFETLSGSRKQETGIGPNGPVVTLKGLEFQDILSYAQTFPEDVDDLRFFIKVIQALDREFLQYGIRQSQTSGGGGRSGSEIRRK